MGFTGVRARIAYDAFLRSVDRFSQNVRCDARAWHERRRNFACYAKAMNHEILEVDEVDVLADRIASSAATVDATMHQLLTHIRRFDALKGWARQGAKTCAHWLSWRVGDALGAAREKVRVARALGDLPLLDVAFEMGQVSFSKVRAITRVANADTEKLLLHYAEYSTGAQLERICRGYRNVERICESGRKAMPQDERFVRRRHCDSGMVRIEAQLTADEADLVFRALEEARREAGKKQEKAPKLGEADEKEQSLADGLVLAAESFLASGPRARTGGTRNQILVHLTEEAMERVSAETSEAPFRAVLGDGSWLSGNALLRLACDAGIVTAKVAPNGSVLDVGRKRRTIPPALLRALHIRDGGCRFPGCTQRAFVEGHHIHHWAHGGETNLENLVLLCGRHHRLVHEEGFEIDRYHDGTPMFIEPRGDAIDDAPPALPPEKRGVLSPLTNRPKMLQRIDLGAAVHGLVMRAGLQ
jgi:hypothetical protein